MERWQPRTVKALTQHNFVSLCLHVGSDDFTPLEPTALTFPATSEVGDTVCQQYTIIGDNVREADETFTISVTAVNSVDIITNQEVVSVTITDDGDG